MSQKGIGRLIQVGLAKETTRGTPISSAAFWVPWMDLTLDEKKEFATDESAYGIIEDNTNLTITKKWAEGSLNGNVADTTIGLLLYSMFGGYAVSGSGPYVHSFTVGENAQHQSLTLFKHDPIAGVDYNFANGMVTKFDLSMELKKFISFNAGLISQSGAAQSAFTPSTTTENRFVPQYISAKLALTQAGVEGTLTATGTAATTTAVTGLSISTALIRVGMTVTGTNVPAGATVAAIVSASAFTLSAATTGNMSSITFGPAVIALKSAKLTITSNVEAQDVLGSISPADFLNKEFSVEGTLEAILQNETDFKTQFMGPTPLAIILDIKLSSSSELYFEMPLCTITEYGTAYKVKDLVYQTVKFKASYSVAGTLLCKAVLTNGTTTY